MDDLREAILRALEQGELFRDESAWKSSLERPRASRQNRNCDETDRPAHRAHDRGRLHQRSSRHRSRRRRARLRGGADRPRSVASQARFEITDKAVDFLGFKTLKDLLGSLGKAVSAATTRATSPPASNPAAARKLYEFGDTLNLDISATLFPPCAAKARKVPHRTWTTPT